MKYPTLTFTKKSIIGGILLILCGILLPVGVFGAIGNYIDLESVEFYTDDNNLIRVKFYVDTTFEINYHIPYPERAGYCETEDYDYWYLPFSVHSPRILDGSPYAGVFTQSLDIVDSATCEDASETYTAGQTYDVYIFKNSGESCTFVLGVDLDNFLIKDNPTCQNSNGCPYETNDTGFFEIKQVEYPEDSFNWQLNSNITINYPTDGSEVDTNFTMEIDYELAETFERLMIIFEEWDASSTCPLQGTEEWNEEYLLGFFHDQSMPYFSDFFTTSTGTTTIDVDDLNAGIYNCVRCFYINESLGTISGELCQEYNLDVSIYIPPIYIPTYYLPIENWDDYYAEHSERFTTSTPLFTNWAETFEPLISWVGNTILFFQSYFEPDVAKAKGEEMGNAIAVARGYIESIDDFFGGLPLSAMFIFYLITAIVIIIYRLVKGILTIIIP